MSANEITTIFNLELPEDLKRLYVMIESNNYKALYDFSHKYIVRLSYLKLTASHQFCISIIAFYKAKEFDQVVSMSQHLYEELKIIQASNF